MLNTIFKMKNLPSAFLIGAYPSSQVGSGNAVVVCGTLLAAYMQVVEYGLVFEV